MDADTQDVGSIRDELRSAFRGDTESAGPAPDIDTTTDATEAPAPAATDTAAPKSSRARDDSGRFAKSSKTAATQKPDVSTKTATPAPSTETTPSTAAPIPGETTATPTPLPGETTQALKAPSSMKAGAREVWDKAPREIQAEFVRLDREIHKSLEEHLESRRFHQSFKDATAAYEPLLRAEGVDTVQAARTLLDTYARLRQGNGETRGLLIAQMARNFGVSPDDLVKGWERTEGGRQAPPQPQPQHIDPRSIVQQVRQEMETERLRSDFQTFSQRPEVSEFLDDVRDDFTALIESGRAKSFEEAYKKACLMNDDVRAILEQRKAAEQANATQASTMRAKIASSSVKSQPSGVSTAKEDDSIRGSLRAAIAAYSGR